jgi:hypothetical protein
MSTNHLDPQQQALVDQLLTSHNQIRLLVYANGAEECHLDEPRVEYFRPGERSFRLMLRNHLAVDISLHNIKEVHLYG